MTRQTTTVRALHDIGIAAWFGGALMGAVGLNGAAGDIADPLDRTRVASSGWARWAPVNAVAIGSHLVGGAVILSANRGRVQRQDGVLANTVVKAAVTAAAIGTTLYSGILGAKIAKSGAVVAEGATTPSESTPDDTAAAQRQQRLLQWATPVLTGIVILLGAHQGEQQRPGGRW